MTCFTEQTAEILYVIMTKLGEDVFHLRDIKDPQAPELRVLVSRGIFMEQDSSLFHCGQCVHSPSIPLSQSPPSADDIVGCLSGSSLWLEPSSAQ